MHKRTFLPQAAAWLGLCIAGLGCGLQGEQPVDRYARQGILLMGNDAEPQDLDPHLVTGFTEHKILLGLFEGLTGLHPETLEVEPAVAESWSVSSDERVYTFQIRAEARWSNGDPVTADDFVFAWKRMLTPQLGAEYAYMLYCLENAEAYHEGRTDDFSEVGVRAVDSHTLEVRLTEPTPYFLSMHIHYAWFPLHRPTLEQFGSVDVRDTRWTLPGNLVGNGPFVLTEWRPNEILVMSKNPHYWDAAAVQLEGVRVYPYNVQTQDRSFRAGELHMTGDVPISRIPVYERTQPDVLKIHPLYGAYYYRFNVTRPPLDDVRVRRALAMAIDRETIVNNVTRGGEPPAGNLTPPDPSGYVCETTIPHDVEQARALLAEAGYPNGQGMPAIQLLYNTSENHKLIAEAIQQQWRQALGVQVTLTNQEWGTYLETMNLLDYDMARSGWYADFLDPINFLECFVTGGGNNRTGWGSPEYDRLLERSRAATDEAERHRLYQQAERILVEEAPIAPIYFYTRKILMSSHVKGWRPNLMAHVPYKYLYLEAPAQ